MDTKINEKRLSGRSGTQTHSSEQCLKENAKTLHDF